MKIDSVYTEDVYSGESDILEVSSIPFDNYKTNPVCIQVRPNDTKEYINEMISRRKQMVSDLIDISYGAKEKKSIENCMKAISKMSGNCNEDLVKKIKSTLIKSSCYDKFPYRDVADLLEEKMTLSKEYTVDNVSDAAGSVDAINEIIISQSVYSLRTFGYIHPKIKLIINGLNKIPMALEFNVEEA